jgi:hypothetical protein
VTKFGFFDIKISGGLLVWATFKNLQHMAAYNHNTSKSCVFSQNLECVSQKMSQHAHINFELSKDLAASIFEPQPQNFGQA